MAAYIMQKAQRKALEAWAKGAAHFILCGKVFTIRHAHDDEYQVFPPGTEQYEIFRIIGGANARILII